MEQPFTILDDPEPAELAADAIGKNLLGALVNELTLTCPAWGELSEMAQGESIARLGQVVRNALTEALGAVFRGNYPACIGELVGVAFKDGIRASLEINKTAHSRHELADSVGQQVVIVIADTEQYFSRMDEIKAKAQQGELFSGELDPTDALVVGVDLAVEGGDRTVKFDRSTGEIFEASSPGCETSASPPATGSESDSPHQQL